MRPGIACGSISIWPGAWQVSAALPGLLHIRDILPVKVWHSVDHRSVLQQQGLPGAGFTCCVYQGLQLH